MKNNNNNEGQRKIHNPWGEKREEKKNEWVEQEEGEISIAFIRVCCLHHDEQQQPEPAAAAATQKLS